MTGEKRIEAGDIAGQIVGEGKQDEKRFYETPFCMHVGCVSHYDFRNLYIADHNQPGRQCSGQPVKIKGSKGETGQQRREH